MKIEMKCKGCGKGEIKYPRGLCKSCFKEALTRRLENLFKRKSKSPRGRDKK